MKIECLTTFLHERDRYGQGDIRTVSDELGTYFVEQGWVKPVGGATEAGETTLDIKNVIQTQEVRHG